MTPYFADERFTLFAGDCLAVMPHLPEASVDAIVTDPPYDLVGASRNGSRRINNPDTAAARPGRGFMGHEWDGSGVAFDPATWAAVLRLARPGARLIAFGGPRTYHRLATAVEDAGWIIENQLLWIFAQGMPKGRSTLKPAHEPMVLARKPSPRVPHLQIDEARMAPGAGISRIGEPSAGKRYSMDGNNGFAALPGTRGGSADGRWPANVVLTDPVFDGGYETVVGGGASKSGKMLPTPVRSERHGIFGDDAAAGYTTMETYGDEGGKSRYFLIAKAGRAERNAGLEDIEHRDIGVLNLRSDSHSARTGQRPKARANVHPTVKPLELMSHLVRLITPPGGGLSRSVPRLWHDRRSCSRGRSTLHRNRARPVLPAARPASPATAPRRGGTRMSPPIDPPGINDQAHTRRHSDDGRQPEDHPRPGRDQDHTRTRGGRRDADGRAHRDERDDGGEDRRARGQRRLTDPTAPAVAGS